MELYIEKVREDLFATLYITEDDAILEYVDEGPRKVIWPEKRRPEGHDEWTKRYLKTIENTSQQTKVVSHEKMMELIHEHIGYSSIHNHDDIITAT